MTSELLYCMRALSHGKITDISNDFSIKDNMPFSVYLRPKTAGSLVHDAILKCKLVNGAEVSDFPVPVNDWTPGAIIQLPANAISLNDYDMYWCAGTEVKPK